MSNKRWLLAIVMAALLILSAAACGKNNTGNNNQPAASAPPANTTSPGGNASTVDAEAIYKQQCVSCHAADLSGGVGPNLQKVGGELTADQINAQIANGGGGMPPFKGNLTSDEISALTTWLSSHK